MKCTSSDAIKRVTLLLNTPLLTLNLKLSWRGRHQILECLYNHVSQFFHERSSLIVTIDNNRAHKLNIDVSVHYPWIKVPTRFLRHLLDQLALLNGFYTHVNPTKTISLETNWFFWWQPARKRFNHYQTECTHPSLPRHTSGQKPNDFRFTF